MRVLFLRTQRMQAFADAVMSLVRRIDVDDVDVRLLDTIEVVE